ncbi:DUF262 domain-containing protein [Candidatus Poribacteria bacterium]|nr:DUF262 domain-containing protein [Candidatus Poribacteria bacterium]
MILGSRENINKLFSIPVQYKVPHYQRRYVWDETNWRKLSEDILAMLGLEFVEDLNSNFSFKSKDTCEDDRTHSLRSKYKDEHFTGILVIRPINEDVPEKFDVIDGQQRLATFQIILCVIRDIFESKGFNNRAQEIEVLIKGTMSTIPYQKFITTKYDESSFVKIINGAYSPLTTHKNKRVIRNTLDTYDFFYKWILCYVQKSESNKNTIDEEKLGDLLSIINTNFYFVPLKLEKNDNSEEIFESLNATGRKLSDFDYLRNNLFLRAGKLGVEPDSNRSYSEIFYDQYWKFEQDGPYYWQTDIQEEFLQAFLEAKLGDGCFSAQHVRPFDMYKKYSMTVAKGIEDEFKELHDFAKSFKP